MRYLVLTLVLLTSVIAAVGCGKQEAPSGAASVVPAGSVIYGEATLRPEGDQKRAVETLIERFPGEGSAGERVQGLIEKAFSESDSKLTYKDDVEPWLGDEAAFFLSDLNQQSAQANGAGLIATDDDGAAMDALEKQAGQGAKKSSYKGHDYVSLEDHSVGGVVDGWVVVGTERAFKAVADTADGGDSIGDDDAYREAIDDAAGDRLGFVYLDAREFAEEAGKQAGGAFGAQLARTFSEPYVATLHASENGGRMEATVPESLSKSFPFLSEGTDAASGLPGDAWLAFSIADFGGLLDYYVDSLGGVLGSRENVEQQFKQATGLDLNEDVIDWMGEMTLFVRGTSIDDLEGALSIETSDEAASARVIQHLAQLFRKSADDGTKIGPLSAPGGGEGVTVTSPEVPKPVHVFQRDGRVVIAYGDGAAKDAFEPASKLGDSPDFQAAEQSLAGDYDVSFYLAVAPIVQLVDSTDAGSEAGWQEVKPYLEPFGAMIAGSRKDGEKLHSAFGVSVK